MAISVICRCSCRTLPHLVALDVDEDGASFSFPLNMYRGFLSRVGVAIRYVLGLSSKGYAYDTVELTVEDAGRLGNVLLDYYAAAT